MAVLFPLGCEASACCLPVHEQPAEAGRLVTEVDCGEEARRRRGAIVSAALHLPMLCPQPAERARVEHTAGLDHAMRGAQQSPRCELTEHRYSIRCQVHVHAVVDPQRGAEPLRRAQGGGVACRSIAPNPSVSGRGSFSAREAQSTLFSALLRCYRPAGRGVVLQLRLWKDCRRKPFGGQYAAPSHTQPCASSRRVHSASYLYSSSEY